MTTSSMPVPVAPSAAVPVAAGETSSSAIAAREKAAVEARYLMALHRPRNADMARQRLLVRCGSPRFAEVAEYAKPVGGGKKARGASIRMMEEVARQWGNVDVQVMVVFDDLERRILHVTATDLESGYSASLPVSLEKTVERRSPRDGDEVLATRVNSEGHLVSRIRADEDAFLVKQNANISKTRRECIRAVVPGDLVDEAMQVCATTRQNEVKADPAAARKRIADSFFSLGVMASQLCELLGKPSLEALTEAEIEYLRFIYAAMKDGEATWTQVIEDHGKKPAANGESGAAPAKGSEGLKAKLEAKKKKPEPVATATVATDQAAEDLAEDRRIAAAEEAQS